MSSVEDRARELFADALRRRGLNIDATAIEGDNVFPPDEHGAAALDAIAAALREQPEARGVVDEDRALAEAFREIAKCSHAQDGVAGELFQAVRNKAAHTAAQQPARPSAPVGVEEKAREILADEYRQAGFYGAADDALADEPSPHCKVTIKAIERALAQQPAQAAPGMMLVQRVDVERLLNATHLTESARLSARRLQALLLATPLGDDAAGGGHGR